jgi:hypothetical protein
MTLDSGVDVPVTRYESRVQAPDGTWQTIEMLVRLDDER